MNTEKNKKTKRRSRTCKRALHLERGGSSEKRGRRLWVGNKISSEKGVWYAGSVEGLVFVDDAGAKMLQKQIGRETTIERERRRKIERASDSERTPTT